MCPIVIILCQCCSGYYDASGNCQSMPPPCPAAENFTKACDPIDPPNTFYLPLFPYSDSCCPYYKNCLSGGIIEVNLNFKGKPRVKIILPRFKQTCPDGLVFNPYLRSCWNDCNPLTCAAAANFTITCDYPNTLWSYLPLSPYSDSCCPYYKNCNDLMIEVNLNLKSKS